MPRFDKQLSSRMHDVTLQDCDHLWQYGNIAVKDEKHPRVRTCLLCNKQENIKNL